MRLLHLPAPSRCQNTNSNLCIGTGGSASFSLLSQANCSGASSQSFTLQPAPVSGYYYLVNTASQLCWDFQNGSSLPGLFSSNILYCASA